MKARHQSTDHDQMQPRRRHAIRSPRSAPTQIVREVMIIVDSPLTSAVWGDWQRLHHGSARTDDQILIYRCRRSGGDLDAANSRVTIRPRCAGAPTRSGAVRNPGPHSNHAQKDRSCRSRQCPPVHRGSPSRSPPPGCPWSEGCLRPDRTDRQTVTVERRGQS